ncbi:hypothetical protein LguiB_020501 [Lonicera macranthoides]
MVFEAITNNALSMPYLKLRNLKTKSTGVDDDLPAGFIAGFLGSEDLGTGLVRMSLLVESESDSEAESSSLASDSK